MRTSCEGTYYFLLLTSYFLLYFLLLTYNLLLTIESPYPDDHLRALETGVVGHDMRLDRHLLVVGKGVKPVGAIGMILHENGLAEPQARHDILLQFGGRKVADIRCGDHGVIRRDHVDIPRARRTVDVGIQRTAHPIGKHARITVSRRVKRLAHANRVGDAAQRHGDIVVGMEILLRRREHRIRVLPRRIFAAVGAATRGHSHKGGYRAAPQSFPIIKVLYHNLNNKNLRKGIELF